MIALWGVVHLLFKPYCITDPLMEITLLDQMVLKAFAN